MNKDNTNSFSPNGVKTQSSDAQDLKARYVAAMQSALPHLDRLIAERPLMSAFDVLHMALEEAETQENRGESWGASSRARHEMIDTFHKWIVEQHGELKKKVANLEQHARSLAPLAEMEDRFDLGLAVNQEYSMTTAEYFSKRERYNVFDEYYLSAVYGECEEFLEMRLPCVRLLWAWFTAEHVRYAEDNGGCKVTKGSI